MRRALLVALLAGSLASAADLEPSPPGHASARELADRLHDDLGAGLAGTIPTVVLEALCELDATRFGKDPGELYERFGYLRTKDDPLPVGVTERRLLGVRLRNYNCLACHAGEENGALVVGAPNRTLDFTGFYDAVFEAVRERAKDVWGRLRLLEAARRCHHRKGELLSVAEGASLLAFAERLAKAELPKRKGEPYGPGRTVVVAAYRRLRFGMDAGPYAPVKPPDLFGVRARSSLLWTGNERHAEGTSVAEKIARNGLLVPWVQVHPLLGKPVPDDVIVSRIDRHRRMADLLAEAAPPPVDAKPSERGRQVFVERCASCHGEYRQEERAGKLVTTVASYEEKLVPVDEVGTDPNYEASQDAEFARRIGETAVGRLYAESCSEQAYVARPLLGLRLRFPYLHNGSVPSLRALLEAPEERPRRFHVGADAVVSRDACGYVDSEPRGPRASLRDTTVPGNRATGHDYGTDLGEADKKALLDYLRSL
jgi:mono/diheme cytochrome c family protein